MKIPCDIKLCRLIVVLAFVVAQSLLVLHTAEHGVLEHSHAGELCEQCVFAKSYHADTPPAMVVAVDFYLHRVTYNTHQGSLIAAGVFSANLARAPPFSS